MACWSLILSADLAYYRETVLQYSVFLHHFSRKKAQERALLIICLNHLLIISRKFGTLICMLLFWREWII